MPDRLAHWLYGSRQPLGRIGCDFKNAGVTSSAILVE